ncbi:MAG: hypothetical protein ACRDN0_40085, partial [Trebonia sp.]
LVSAHIAPFYAEQAAVDGLRLGRMRHVIFGEPEHEPEREPASAPESAAAETDRVGYWQVRAAAAFDPAVFRAFWKVMGMIAVPGEVYADPEVIARTREVLSQHDTAPPAAKPSRAQVLAALA